MDIWHKIGRSFKIANLGTLIFFALNLVLIILVFGASETGQENVTYLVTIYFITVIIAVSPIGELFLVLMIGAKPVRRKDFQIKIVPLLEIVLEKTKENFSYTVNEVNLTIIHDDTPNAFAVGRKTICITDALLNLPDEDILGVLTHEVGHLAYGHSIIQLIIGGGNVFIWVAIFLIKIACWTITAIIGLFAIRSRRFISGVILAGIASLSSVLIWLWTKFCLLFLRWSMRQNEFVADEFAYNIGFGNQLAKVIDESKKYMSIENSFLKALCSTHPDPDERIARLQEMGATYNAYISRF